jgi:hypothetical protein
VRGTPRFKSTATRAKKKTLKRRGKMGRGKATAPQCQASLYWRSLHGFKLTFFASFSASSQNERTAVETNTVESRSWSFYLTDFYVQLPPRDSLTHPSPRHSTSSVTRCKTPYFVVVALFLLLLLSFFPQQALISSTPIPGNCSHVHFFFVVVRRSAFLFYISLGNRLRFRGSRGFALALIVQPRAHLRHRGSTQRWRHVRRWLLTTQRA